MSRVTRIHRITIPYASYYDTLVDLKHTYHTAEARAIPEQQSFFGTSNRKWSEWKTKTGGALWSQDDLLIIIIVENTWWIFFLFFHIGPLGFRDPPAPCFSIFRSLTWPRLLHVSKGMRRQVATQKWSNGQEGEQQIHEYAPPPPPAVKKITLMTCFLLNNPLTTALLPVCFLFGPFFYVRCQEGG